MEGQEPDAKELIDGCVENQVLFVERCRWGMVSTFGSSMLSRIKVAFTVNDE